MPRKKGMKTAAGGLGFVQNLRAYRDQLAAQRAELDTRLAAADTMLHALGGGPVRVAVAAGRAAPAPVKRGRGRPPRAGSLKEFILKVLNTQGGVMAVKDIATGVVQAGYDSKNQTLAKSVGIALTELKSVKKVGRGKFCIK